VVKGGDGRKGGEMTQTLYVHMNKKKRSRANLSAYLPTHYIIIISKHFEESPV
jgi:hypothetical protein